MSQGTAKVWWDASAREINKAIHLFGSTLSLKEKEKQYKKQCWFLTHNRIKHWKTLFLTASYIPPLTSEPLHFLDHIFSPPSTPRFSWHFCGHTYIFIQVLNLQLKKHLLWDRAVPMAREQHSVFIDQQWGFVVHSNSFHYL